MQCPRPEDNHRLRLQVNKSTPFRSGAICFFFSIFLSICHLPSYFLHAQNLSAYSDYKNYFYVFDDGVSKQLEYLPVQWFKIGGNTVVYLDNTNTLRAYYKGEKYILSEIQPTACTATDNMIVYFSGSALKIFDKGNTILLSSWATDCIIGDSMVGCVDNNIHAYKIYYNGQEHYLPDVLDYPVIKSFCIGDNILAYKNMDEYLKIHYRNQIFNMEVYQPARYKASANTVAFVNESTQEFSVFYKGAVSVLEKQPPISFSVSDDMVAYVDGSQNFKVFYNGEIVELSSFAPQFYKAEDNILVYSDNVNFSVFYKGKTTVLEKNIPKEYKIDVSTLAYNDLHGFLNVFFEGKTIRASSEKINGYQLSGNTVKFSDSMNEWHFFVNGKTF